MERIACIGLAPRNVEALKKSFDGAVLTYEVPPRMYSMNGKLFAESRSIVGKWLSFEWAYWYGYYPGDQRVVEARKALGLSSAGKCLDFRNAVLHDDRTVSLMLAEHADPSPSLPRGYLPKGTRTLAFEQPQVFKVGNDHCGDGKHLMNGFNPEYPAGGIIEPFLKGESVRVLIIGKKAWVLRYQSKKGDWRANVDPLVTELHVSTYPGLVPRSRTIAERLGLRVLGIDYLGHGDLGLTRWDLLEVNAYPGLDDAAGAHEAYEELLVEDITGGVGNSST